MSTRAGKSAEWMMVAAIVAAMFAVILAIYIPRFKQEYEYRQQVSERRAIAQRLSSEGVFYLLHVDKPKQNGDPVILSAQGQEYWEFTFGPGHKAYQQAQNFKPNQPMVVAYSDESLDPSGPLSTSAYLTPVPK